MTIPFTSTSAPSLSIRIYPALSPTPSGTSTSMEVASDEALWTRPSFSPVEEGKKTFALSYRLTPVSRITLPGLGIVYEISVTLGTKPKRVNSRLTPISSYALTTVSSPSPTVKSSVSTGTVKVIRLLSIVVGSISWLLKDSFWKVAKYFPSMTTTELRPASVMALPFASVIRLISTCLPAITQSSVRSS